MAVVLGWITAGWLGGLLAGQWLGGGPWQAPACLAVLGGGLAALAWGLRTTKDQARSHRGVRAALVAGALVAGLATRTDGARAPPLPPAGLARVDAEVERVRHGSDGRARTLLRIIRGARLEDDEAIAPRTLLWAGPAPLPEGARVRFVGKVAPREAFRNDSPHPRHVQADRPRGRVWVARSDAVEVTDRGGLHGAIGRARAHVRERLAWSLPAHTSAVARALVLGDGDAVQEDARNAVRDAGLAHVLAVSGLHVTILAGVLVGALWRALLLLPIAARYEMRRVACALGVPLALLVGTFAGGAVSAKRAALTAALGWALVAMGRRPVATQVAAAAVLSLGMLAPTEMTQPGALLSIAATAAILSGEPITTTGLASLLRAAARVSWRTSIATAPIVVWCFGAAPLIGIAANVLLIPVGALLVVLAAMHALLACVGLAAVSAPVLVSTSDAFVAACDVLGALGPHGPWPPLDVAQGIALVLVAIGLLAARRWPARIALIVGATVVLGGLEWRLRDAETPRGRLRATFLDVGQGDAALIDLPDGRLMLIDAGGNPAGGPNPGKAVLVPLLQARRRAHVDIAVLSHPHPDHYGGLQAVLDTTTVGELWDSGQATREADLSTTSAQAAALLANARAAGVRIREPRELCGRATRAGEAVIRVLSPCPRYDAGYGPNDNSLVVRIDFGQHALLFAGDAEAHAEATLLANGSPLRADVLKVGHHGSRTSSGPAFLDAVAPRIAIVSAGAANSFDHPHSDVMQRLRTRTPHTLSLAEHGGAVVESDGAHLTASTWSGERVEL